MRGSREMSSWIFLLHKVPGRLPDDYPKCCYNCGILWFKGNLKINPLCHLLSETLTCFGLFWNVVRWKQLSLFPRAVQVRLYTFLSLQFHSMRMANIWGMSLLSLLPFRSHADKLPLNFCPLSILHLAQIFLSFLILFLTFPLCLEGHAQLKVSIF